MIGMLDGNVKVFTHTEINNRLWQDILMMLKKYKIKRSYNYKDTILNVCDKQNVNIRKLHSLITEKLKADQKIDEDRYMNKHEENY